MSIIFLGNDCIYRRDGTSTPQPLPDGSVMMEETPQTLGVDIVRIKLVGGVITVFDYTPSQMLENENKELIDLIISKVGKAMFQHENRIRVLEGLSQITVEQFKTGIQNL